MSDDKALIERMTIAVKKSHQALKVVQDENKKLKQENEELKKKLSTLETQLKKQASAVTVVEPPHEFDENIAHTGAISKASCATVAKRQSMPKAVDQQLAPAACIDPPDFFENDNSFVESRNIEEWRVSLNSDRSYSDSFSSQINRTSIHKTSNASATKSEPIKDLTEQDVKRRKIDHENKSGAIINPVAGSWLPPVVTAFAYREIHKETHTVSTIKPSVASENLVKHSVLGGQSGSNSHPISNPSPSFNSPVVPEPKPTAAQVRKFPKSHGSESLQPDLISMPEKQRASKIIQALSSGNYRNVARALSSLPLHLVVKSLLNHMHVTITRPVLVQYAESITHSTNTVPSLPSSYMQPTLTPLIKMLVSICAEKESGVGYGTCLVRELVYRLAGRCRRRLHSPMLMLLEGVDKGAGGDKLWETWRDTLRITVREEDSSKGAQDSKTENREKKQPDQKKMVETMATSVDFSNVSVAKTIEDTTQQKNRDELAWMLSLSDDEEDADANEVNHGGDYNDIYELRQDLKQELKQREFKDIDRVEDELGDTAEVGSLERMDGVEKRKLSGNLEGENMSANSNAVFEEESDGQDEEEGKHDDHIVDEIDDQEDNPSSEGSTSRKSHGVLSLESALLHQQLSDHALAHVIISILMQLESDKLWEEFVMAIVHHTYLSIGMGVLHAFLLHHSSLPTHRHHIDLICSVALFEADVSISTFKHGARSNSPTCPKYVTCLYEHTVCQHSLLQHYMPQKQLAALPQDNLSWYKYGLLSSLHMHVGCLSDLGLGGIGAMVEQAKGVLGAFQICILPDHKSDTQYTCKNLLECDLLMSTDILDRFTIAAKQEAYVDVHKYANHFAIYFEEQYHTYSDKTAYWQAICKSIKTLDHNILTHWRHSLDERHGGVRSGSSMEGVQLTILAKTKMGVIKDTIHRLHSIADYPSHNDIVLNNLMQLYENVYTSMHGMFAHHQHTHLYKMTQDSDKEEISKMLFTEHCSITVQEVRLMADILDHIQAQYLAPFKSMLNTYPPQHDIHVTVNKLYGHVNMVVQYIVLFMMERFTTMYFHSMVGLLQHVRSALLLCNGVTGVEVIDVITCVVHSLYEQLPNPWGVFIHGELQVQVIHALLDIHATAQDISLQRQSRHLITHFMKLQSDFAPVVLVINLGRRPDRWRHALREASKWKFIVYRIPAVDAKAFSDTDAVISIDDVLLDWNCSLNAMFDERYAKYTQQGGDSMLAMTPSERGCAMSHLLIWKALHILSNPLNAPSTHLSGAFGRQIQQIADDLHCFYGSIVHLLRGFYLVCEDDMQVNITQIVVQNKLAINNVVSHYHHTLLTELLYVIKKAPADADLIYLGGVVPKGNKVIKNIFRNVFVKVNYIWQLHGYLIHRDAIPKLLQHLPISMPVDNFVAALAYEGKLTVYTLVDTMLIQKGGALQRRAVDTDVVHSV